MKKRILLCNEFSLFSTGYSTYGRELLNRLYQTGKYEIAELASFISSNDKRIVGVPWKVYGVLPTNDNEKKIYDNTPLAEFGTWNFEKVALDFKPDTCISIRDDWMDAHIGNSPLKHCYKWIYMPTVDSEPQMEQWLDTMTKADKILCYNDWSVSVLNKSGIKNYGACPPSASKEFQPIDNAKEKFGLDKNVKIIGTVMRNQRRKLFPNLFKAFKDFLNNTGRTDVYLYCHTSYPDAGWDIPHYLKYFGLTTRVLFTYLCTKCYNTYPSLFCDVNGVCPNCGGKSVLPNAHAGIDDNLLAMIYNCFDLYIQYATNEGFGMPQVEAAACGVPVAATDYSAMADVVRKLNGFPIPVLDFAFEPESGCKKAIPNDKAAADLFTYFFSLSEQEIRKLKNLSRSGFEKHYSSWDVVAEKWMTEIDSLEPGNWSSPSRVNRPSNQIPQNLSNIEFVKWLLCELLGEPNLQYSYMATRLIRDLNQGFTSWGPSGYYFNENSINLGKPKFDKFDREIAIKHILGILEKKNFWEEQRCKKN